MNSIEIFAGGGGLALGIKQAGFSHTRLVEWDSDSTKTLYRNYENFGFSDNAKWVYNDDIRKLSFNDCDNKIDLLSGGPPCQPFSIGGKHKAYKDDRDMFPEAARVLNEIKPKAFIFENVRGILRKNFAKYFGYIVLQLTYPEIQKKTGQNWLNHLERLEKYHTSAAGEKGLYYNVVFRLVNAADYGIPQKRERVFIVGFRNDINGEWSFPEPTHSEDALIYSKYTTGEYFKKYSIKKSRNQRCKNMSLFASDKKPWVTVRDVLHNLPNPCEINEFYNHRLQDGAKVYTGHTGSLLDEPSKTIKAGDHGVPGGENMVVLDDGTVRYYTIREAARIQTFPDDYYFPCSWTESMRQIGNAVPVKLATVVAGSVKETLTSSKRSGKNNGYKPV
jgi:DNA (cytosine-5)-methyltransferase 1